MREVAVALNLLVFLRLVVRVLRMITYLQLYSLQLPYSA